MSVVESTWIVIARFSSAVSAEALVALLRECEIQAYLENADPLSVALGGHVRVVIPERDTHRARFAIASAELTDAETWFLATGELDPAAARAAFTRDRDAATVQMRRATGIAGGLAIALLIVGALISR